MFSNKKLETLFAKAEKYIPQIKKYFKFENRLQEIEAFEKKLAIKFPDSFKEFYSVINGEIKYSGLFIFSLLPFENILRAWKDYFEGGTGEENTDFATIEDDVVKPFFEHPKRIPFLSDGSGNFVGFDFIPESKGQLGQIINLDLGEISGYFLRLFNSFDDYIDFITRSLDNGKIYPIFDDEESYFESSYRIWDDFIHHNSNENVLDKISIDVKKAIAKTQFKQDINKIDLRKVTEFGHWNFPDYKGTLEELAYFPNLRLVSIRGDLNYDYQNLLKCPKLTTLYIGFVNDDKLIDLISELKTLKNLSISNSTVTSFNVLKKLKKLTSISLEKTHVKNVDFIESLKGLKSITLSQNSHLYKFPDISKHKLEYIKIPNSNFKGIQLSNFTTIKEIDLSMCLINDFLFLDNLNENVSIGADYENFKKITTLFPLKFNFMAYGFSDKELEEYRLYMDSFWAKSKA